MKSRIKKRKKKKEKKKKQFFNKFKIPNKKKNVLEWEQERCAPGADLNQSNIYQRKVENTCIIVSTCMINFRIESSLYLF